MESDNGSSEVSGSSGSSGSEADEAESGNEDVSGFEDTEVCKEFQADVEALISVYGPESIIVHEPVLDSVIVEICVDVRRHSHVSRSTAQAWGIDAELPIVLCMVFSVSSYLRYQRPHSLSILQKYPAPPSGDEDGGEGDAKQERVLGVRTQLMYIVSSFINRWRVNGVNANALIHDRMTEMGFTYTQAYVAAGSGQSLDQCLADVSDVSSIGEGFLCELMEYVCYRLQTLNTYCIICDQKHLFGGSLNLIRPAVCRRELCAFTYQQFGVVAEMATSSEVIDLLIAMAKAAANSTRAKAIFNPFPMVFDPQSRGSGSGSLILNPDNPDHALAKNMLGRVSVPFIVATDINLPETLLVQWIISSNRTHIAKLTPDKHLKCMKTDHQYVMISASPEKEEEFQLLKAKYGSTFAFHGSRVENWHSILRNGLKNASGTSLQLNGAAYGKGIYLSTAASMSLGYSSMSYVNTTKGATDDEVLTDGNWICLALCEVIKDDTIKKSGQIWVVPKEECVTTRFFFVYKGLQRHVGVLSESAELLQEVQRALA